MTGTTPWQAQDNIEAIQADTIGALANIAGFNTLAGCDASYSAANMNVTVAAGSITHTNAMKTVAGGTVTLVSDPTNPRWTYRYINSSGVAAIVSGSPAAIPAVPDTGANPTNGLDYVQAGLTVANNATYKLDKRVMVPILGYNGGVIVAASTLPITAQMHHVSGTTTITAFPNFASGIVVYLTFDAATPITHNAASLILSGGGSVTAAVGETMAFRSEGSGNWRQISDSALTQTFFNSLQTAFRVPRRLLGLFTAINYTGSDGTPTAMAQQVGIGFLHGNGSGGNVATGTLTNLLLEAYTASVTSTTTTDDIGSVLGNATVVAGTAPNKNPRMSIRWFPGTSSASLTTTLAGFLAAGVPTATAAGAYLRANTTGNLFFVTRQGGSETTTDLGARPTALTSYEIETTDAGVTWTCRNTTTGAVVATHTTNIPTATVALGFVIAGVSALNSLNAYNVAYCEVESNSVA